MRWLAILIFNVWLTQSNLANGINFIEDISVDQAKALAKAQNKHIFIETYATWCIPCRKLEKTLLDPELVAFFNEKFVNVRINMDLGTNAPEYKSRLQVVFLPTVAILNQDGEVRFQADRILSKTELLSVSTKALDPNLYVPNMTTAIESNPMTNSGFETRGPETIIHVLGQNSKGLPPDMIRQEAYFRVEFMDGSHIDASRRYLETQVDWTTPINLRFILDFVADVNSKEWEYLISNKPLFEQVLGKDMVDRTLQIVIYNHLYQGFPRPTLEQAINLYSLIDAKECHQLAYKYVLSRSLDECNHQDFHTKAETYLTTINPKDHRIMYYYAQISIDESVERQKIGLKWIQESISLVPEDIDYHMVAAELQAKLGNTKDAQKTINQAFILAEKQGRNISSLQAIKNNLTSISSKNKG